MQKDLEKCLEEGIIVEDPLNLIHLLTKYYIEELMDDITRYHVTNNYQ